MQGYNIACFCVWSNTLREERRLRVTENRHKRDEVTGKWTKLRGQVNK